MVGKRRVVWTHHAIQEFKDTCHFWNQNNGNNNYSIKLRKLVKAAIERLAVFPFGGTPSGFMNVRFVVVRDYLLFYDIQGGDIVILSFWDGRQNPARLENRLG